MSFFGRLFKKAASRGINRFDDIKQVVTRPLPIPGLPLENGARLVIKADRNYKTGYWSIYGEINILRSLPQARKAIGAFQAIAARHMDVDVKSLKRDRADVDFDVAFKIMRETEETLLNHGGFTAGPEPRGHFMTAYRLLPAPLQEEIDGSYFQNLHKNDWILPPAAKTALSRAPTPGGKAF